MKQYIKLLQKILDKGIEKESGRANMPNTFGIEFGKITMNLKKGFPLLTTKKMFWKGIVHELLWFLRGETNIHYLVENGVNIWNGDAYRWYLKWWNHYKDLLAKKEGEDSQNPYSLEEFIGWIKDGDLIRTRLKDLFYEIEGFDYKLGDLGKVYGHQWRDQNGVDQVQEVLDGLKTNPWSRYHIIDGWNKADFRDMSLPPCHLLYQFIVKPMSREERLKYFTEKYKPLFPFLSEDVNRVLENHN